MQPMKAYIIPIKNTNNPTYMATRWKRK